MSHALNVQHFFPFFSQALSKQWNVPMNAPSICSSTLCWTQTSRVWPTGAATKELLKKVFVSTVARIAATHWATISRRFAVATARGSTWKQAPGCLSNVRGCSYHFKPTAWSSLVIKYSIYRPTVLSALIIWDRWMDLWCPRWWNTFK